MFAKVVYGVVEPKQAAVDWSARVTNCLMLYKGVNIIKESGV